MKILNALLIAGLLISCQKNNCIDDEGVPSCIITQSNEITTCAGTKTNEYKFQGELVYVIEVTCCCDYGSPVFNASCETLGALGGFIGNTKINGIEFGANATFVRTVWMK
jgi:hypothetical protein